jgi:amidohydrolase
MDIINRIKILAGQFTPQVIAYRRHIHQNPELSFEEEKTAAYISDILTSLHVELKSGVGGHGVVGIINGHKENIIALRADMDALPIQEESDRPYKSKVKGVMHACGHDVHTACLLGAVHILNSLKADMNFGVKFIFQPAEEKLPGGASIMIRDGALLHPKPFHIIGQHVFPSLEAGKVGIRPGLYMASTDEIYITIKGRGGHAAMPHETIDTVFIAAQVIVALQTIVSRYGDPSVPTVLSIGKINSVGGATNVIPDEVKLEGTFRTMNEDWRKRAHGLIKKIVLETSSSYGGDANVKIEVGYPCLINEPEYSQKLKNGMIAYLGRENVVDLPIRMTAEDFAFYTQEIPGCFYRLGTGNIQKGITAPVHTSTFDVDESALTIGMGLMAYLAYCSVEH